ncbi:hypothetical protein SAMN04488012_103229 [Palleronia salina]|uniref:Uncharacterized protein n=1 Tax=Palleronia salina TaxID=313368 RepID=A0A1M6EV38_9RHOB|nr:hypothetical protein [Palleronia salina]SHI89278.1 hypothetical protein SAMN04488012_103229 [Palleronia salina]
MLRESGHAKAAREVLIAKDHRQRWARYDQLRAVHLYEDAMLLGLANRVLRATTAYGRKPLRAFWWLAGLVLLGWCVFGWAGSQAQIKPNAVVALRSAEWTGCVADAGEKPDGVECFETSKQGASYPRFNSFIYSVDTLLPIVSLEMQGFWLPDETAGSIGKLARIYLWIHIALGWALSLLAVAGFSGLIKQDNT